MISSDSMRGYNDLLILQILSAGDSYGYEISKKIRDGSQEKYLIKETTLYSAFNRLEKSGWLISYPGELTHGRPRTYYKISAKGRQVLADKKEEWRTIQAIVNAFIDEGE